MAPGCSACREDQGPALDFSMAFQPIVSTARQRVFAYEALVRGRAGQGARFVLDQARSGNLYAFDQQCRVKAIELAAGLGIAQQDAMLSINFLPNAVYEPRACIRMTLDAAAQTGFPPDRIIFEFSESERLDPEHTLNILKTYTEMGFKVAIDDFGAGHSGLAMLTRVRPDIVKLDMELIRGVDADPVKRKIILHLMQMLHDLEIMPIAEGIETDAEKTVLADLGVDLMQGYLFAKPAFEALSDVYWGG